MRGQVFCSICSCVLRETSVVDNTERRKTEREKSFPAAHHREKKFFFLEKNETVLKYAEIFERRT